MSYTITYTNGKILAYLPDQSTDTVSTSLDLVGKNSNAYGSSINNNFVHLLENFANRSAPRSPTTGQLWYDTLQGVLKIYSNNLWKSVGTPVLSPTQPASLLSGEFWFDTIGQRLWYYNGVNLVSLAKPYSDFDGKNGALAEKVIDQDGAEQNIIAFYVDGVLTGWFSDKAVTLNLAANANYIAATTQIQPGFTLNPTVSGQYFNGTATSALSLAGFTSDQASRLTDLFGTGEFATSASIAVANDQGLAIAPSGSLGQHYFRIQNSGVGDTKLVNEITSASTYLLYNQTAVGMLLDGAKKSIGFFTNTVGLSVIDMNADTVMRNSMTVYGNTLLGSTASGLTLQTGPKIIDMGKGQNNLDGIGLRVYNNQSKYWLYNNTNNWWTTDNANINARDTYYLFGQYPVLSINTSTGKGTLGAFVETADGLKTLPTLRSLTIGDQNDVLGQLIITTATISSTLNMYFKPGSFADFNYKQIRNVQSTKASDDPAVVTTKDYVDTQINAKTGGGYYKPYVLSLDITGFTNTNAQILGYLNATLPVDGGDVSYYSQPEGARCTVLCTRYTSTTATFILNLSENKIPYSYTVTSTNTVTGITTSFNTATTLVTDVAGTVLVNGPLPKVQYSAKLYQVVSFSTSTPVSITSGYVSNNGTTLVIQNTNGIVAGAVVSGNGYLYNEVVVAVLNSNTVVTSSIPDAAPVANSPITFTSSPGFKGWTYIKEITV
jgi:hypothetical protein